MKKNRGSKHTHTHTQYESKAYSNINCQCRQCCVAGSNDTHGSMETTAKVTTICI